MEILHKEFTLTELVDLCKGANENVKIYNSDYLEAPTVDFLFQGDMLEEFEPVVFLDHDTGIVQAVYSFHKDVMPMTVKQLREFYFEMPCVKDSKIERDVEDGYRFEFYDTAVLTDNYLVLL